MKTPLTLLYFLLNAALAFSQNSNFEKKINALISFKVDTISVSTLEKNEATYLILDARELNEFKVGHLTNAQCVGYDFFNESSFLKNNPNKNQPIAIYCSIGVRSEHIGLKLKALGYTQVKNVYGGIFEWANQGKPMVDLKGNSTDNVHAFSKEWGIWLEKGNKIYDN